MEVIKSSTFKNVETEKIVKEQVSSIIEDIKINKDEALKKYNLKFDNNNREVLRVSKEEILRPKMEKSIIFLIFNFCSIRLGFIFSPLLSIIKSDSLPKM